VERWCRVLAPSLEGKRKGTLDWSDTEVIHIYFPCKTVQYISNVDRYLRQVNLLTELVGQHTLPATWNHRLNSLGEERTDWTAIGAILGRLPSCCCAKWRSIMHRTMKRGPFTLAEDAYIERRVREWGNKGMGLWSVLEKEMNRSDHSMMEDSEFARRITFTYCKVRFNVGFLKKE